MDEISDRQLMQLSATSRDATADVSDIAVESPGAASPAVPALGDLLELGLESLLQHFRRK